MELTYLIPVLICHMFVTAVIAYFPGPRTAGTVLVPDQLEWIPCGLRNVTHTS